ncbi:hypothetical protein B0H12DRAFT_828726 [Mycena haematopus]|nr:hypothetical protein B0H12DRAFT_828726 [Mycena haematopus]
MACVGCAASILVTTFFTSSESYYCTPIIMLQVDEFKAMSYHSHYHPYIYTSHCSPYDLRLGFPVHIFFFSFTYDSDCLSCGWCDRFASRARDHSQPLWSRYEHLYTPPAQRSLRRAFYKPREALPIPRMVNRRLANRRTTRHS